MPEHAPPPADRGTAATTRAAAYRSTGAGPCTWPVVARSRAFTECPGTQIAAMARARAMAAMGSADAPALPSRASWAVAGQPVPTAAFPLIGRRGPGRYCVGTFPGQREQVGQARAFLAAFLGGWARTDDAVLLIGELGANAVVHTGSGAPGGLFTVRASLSGAWLQAEVEDQGSTWNGRLEDAECPHGLFLLRQLSARCGTRRTRKGWATWFVLSGTPDEDL